VSDQYDFWRRRLDGEVITITEDPQAGFYRLKTAREGVWYPVAIWYNKEGQLRCRIGDHDVDEQNAMERWPYVSKTPIKHEVYKAVMAGEPWPDQHEAVIRDRQNSQGAPDDQSFEGLKDRIEDLARDAEVLIKAGAAKDQTAADRASDLANRLGELQKQADAARAAEKRPHDEASKAVQAKWAPLLTTSDIYRRIKAVVITPWLTAETARQKAEATAAAARGDDVAPRSAPKAGSGGRRSVALRTVKIVTIIDRSEVLKFFEGNDQITEVLQTLAQKAVNAGVKVPGVEVREDSRAA
jgi:hypothetical protein